MPNKNFDSVKKPKNPGQIKHGASREAGIFSVDSVVRRRVKALHYIAPPVRPVFITPFFRMASRANFLRKAFSQKKVPVFAVLAALVIAFGGGMWAVLNTSKSAADNQPQVLGEETTVPSGQSYSMPLNATSTALGPVNTVPNDVLFNMTIGQLENYMAEEMKSPQDKQDELLAERKIKLKAYLEEKSSPLADIADTIAELKHWQMVLAISNSESSLGKRCYNNNCSGIGVEPGNPLWHNYPSKAAWAEDLDKLLDKRYNNWTLDEMNGVYNKPGSANWLLASKQILQDLQDRGIE